MTIDIEKLRETLKQDLQGAYFGGGFGAALMEAMDLDRASPEDLVRLSRERGLNLRLFQLQGDDES